MSREQRRWPSYKLRKKKLTITKNGTNGLWYEQSTVRIVSGTKSPETLFQLSALLGIVANRSSRVQFSST